MLLAAGLLALFPAAALICSVTPADGSLTVCFFRTITGHNCPFCGLTRAFAAASQGDFRRAQVAHSLWGVMAVLVLALAGVALVDAVSGRNVSGSLARVWRWVAIPVAAVFVAAWLLGRP